MFVYISDLCGNKTFVHLLVTVSWNAQDCRSVDDDVVGMLGQVHCCLVLELKRTVRQRQIYPHVSEATQRAAELRGEITSKTTKQFCVLGLAAASASEGLTARGIVGSIHNEFQRIHLCMPQHSLGGRMERRAGQRPQPRGRTVDVVGRRCRN